MWLLTDFDILLLILSYSHDHDIEKEEMNENKDGDDTYDELNGWRILWSWYIHVLAIYDLYM